MIKFKRLKIVLRQINLKMKLILNIDVDNLKENHKECLKDNILVLKLQQKFKVKHIKLF